MFKKNFDTAVYVTVEKNTISAATYSYVASYVYLV